MVSITGYRRIKSSRVGVFVEMAEVGMRFCAALWVEVNIWIVLSKFRDD